VIEEGLGGSRGSWSGEVCEVSGWDLARFPGSSVGLKGNGGGISD